MKSRDVLRVRDVYVKMLYGAQNSIGMKRGKSKKNKDTSDVSADMINEAWSGDIPVFNNHINTLKSYSLIKKIVWNCVTSKKFFNRHKSERLINLELLQGLMKEIEQKFDVIRFLQVY